MSTVLLEKHAGYAILTLNRPAQKNALSRELRADFVAALENCCGDDAVRVLIITGAGDAFCAGFDLKELGSGHSANAAEEVNNAMARAIKLMGEVSSPGQVKNVSEVEGALQKWNALQKRAQPPH